MVITYRLYLPPRSSPLCWTNWWKYFINVL